ncbi:hypothetical protein OPS28_11905 [Alteromonas ponticola]|nr:hypothetical protein [Alteromonas sp. ASW11-130]
MTRDDTKGPPKGEIRSLHVEGLPGDVTDPWEYEDFGPTTGPWPDPVIDATKSSFVWSVFDNGRNPLLLDGNSEIFSFDSDYVLADALKTGKFRVGVDWRRKVGGVFRDVVIWSDVFTDMNQFPFERIVQKVPAPASGLVFATGMLCLWIIRRKRSCRLKNKLTYQS